ncbi:Cell division protein SepF [Leucobacter aridicollis]|uniref:Cell division protein SepF n=1 Tax=Leucobacter aridicollis TaxID=283878 RepID=A0A852RIN2_9MICO|nr:cell division protein SepF [Leucobacter aridicollis]MBL3683862.1 cell division protein SepF [Leucobacter aridicollis]MCS3428582.1 cell division inhibitor SepF [Leucobacter aridicollis]NYD26542.1 cell division inhibitor SepF [Leucobacter aridicollis]RKQ84075.1 cell division inhibitor SepF [Mycolicibacterium mucogenicum 261Sha1.1M5]
MSNPLKKTMVFLGLAEEGLEEEPVAQAAPEREPAPSAQAAAKPTQAPRPAVAPLRRVTPVRNQAPQAMNEIFTVHPTAYRDAQVIAESFRDGIPVIMNLSRMSDDEAKRLIDFSSGLTLGLNGRIERVTSKVFLLTPEHIEVGSDEPASEADGSFFVAPTA